MGRIKVGTASWTDKTLLASGWYPDDADDPERRLEYYASQFPLVEVDSTYYTPPNERNAQPVGRAHPADFTFNIKAFSLLTQHPTRVSALYKDLRPETDKANVYLKDLDEPSSTRYGSDSWSAGAARRRRPARLRCSSSSRRGSAIARRTSSTSSSASAAASRTGSASSSERLVDGRGEPGRDARLPDHYALPYIVVDMPQGYRSSVPPVVAATADLSVVRFHGHSDKWQSKDIYERFGYLYSEDELREWAPKVEQLAAKASEVHVLLNNCYRDYAQRNARQLADLLDVDHS